MVKSDQHDGHRKKSIGRIVDRSATCYLAYVDECGFPVTKAMLSPRERNGVRTIWFSTNTSSNKVRCFRANPKASVYFVDRRSFRGVSLVGTMEVLETDEARQRIWREGDEVYYPAGVSDPDYCVLRFTTVRGRYYSNFKSEDFEIGL
ncbi:MAG: pyridoxamine 5'-phosphate oxidase family protein [Candidatus Cryptobacteroides sp.]